MDLRNALQDTLDGVDAVVDLLEQLTKLTETARDDDAVAVLRTVHSALQVALSGVHGLIDPIKVREWVNNLRSQIEANDRAADQALDLRFPPGDD
jgi:hypothetical protein